MAAQHEFVLSGQPVSQWGPRGFSRSCVYFTFLLTICFQTIFFYLPGSCWFQLKQYENSLTKLVWVMQCVTVNSALLLLFYVITVMHAAANKEHNYCKTLPCGVCTVYCGLWAALTSTISQYAETEKEWVWDLIHQWWQWWWAVCINSDTKAKFCFHSNLSQGRSKVRISWSSRSSVLYSRTYGRCLLTWGFWPQLRVMLSTHSQSDNWLMWLWNFV